MGIDGERWSEVKQRSTHPDSKGPAPFTKPCCLLPEVALVLTHIVAGNTNHHMKPPTSDFQKSFSREIYSLSPLQSSVFYWPNLIRDVIPNHSKYQCHFPIPHHFFSFKELIVIKNYLYLIHLLFYMFVCHLSIRK